MSLELFSGLAKLEFSGYEFSSFKLRIKKLLMVNSKKRLNSEEQEEQFKKILQILIDFNPMKSFKKYRAGHRNKFNEFSAIMLKLLPTLESPVNNLDPVEIKVNLGTYERPNSKFFKLPISPQGNSHFLKAFKAFILTYYEDNPPFKYYKGLDPNLSLEYFQNETREMKRVNLPTIQKLSDRFIYDLHLILLRLIRNFPQFKSSRLSDYNISNKEAEFILKLLGLLDYNSFYHDVTSNKRIIKPIQMKTKAYEEDFTTTDIKKLRNDLYLYGEAIELFMAKKP